MPLQVVLNPSINNAFSLFDELIYLRSIIDSATDQLKKISSNDLQLSDLIKSMIVLNNSNLKEIDIEVWKELTRDTVKEIQLDNVVSVMKKHEDAFENSLYLATMIVNSYRRIIDNKFTNFTIRKKLQTQLNKVLYLCLQIKLLRQNPCKIPHKLVGQLF